MKSDAFLELSREEMMLFVERDSLKVKEAALFDAVVKWATLQCEKNEMEVRTMSFALFDAISPNIKLSILNSNFSSCRFASKAVILLCVMRNFM